MLDDRGVHGRLRQEPSPTAGEIPYFVLVDRAVPYLLARVRWPDVAQAISAAQSRLARRPRPLRPAVRPERGEGELRPGSLRCGGMGHSARRRAGRGRTVVPAAHARELVRSLALRAARVGNRARWDATLPGSPRPPVHGRPQRAQRPRSRAPARSPYAARGPRAHPLRRCDPVGWARRPVHWRGGVCGAGCVAAASPPTWTFAAPFLLEAGLGAARICLDVTSRISWYRSDADGTQFGVTFAELARR